MTTALLLRARSHPWPECAHADWGGFGKGSANATATHSVVPALRLRAGVGCRRSRCRRAEAVVRWGWTTDAPRSAPADRPRTDRVGKGRAVARPRRGSWPGKG